MLLSHPEGKSDGTQHITLTLVIERRATHERGTFNMFFVLSLVLDVGYGRERLLTSGIVN